MKGRPMFRVMLPLALTMGLLGQAEAASPSFPFSDTILQGGALAVLAWLAWHLVTKEMPAARKAFTATLDSMAKRHERWETQRHEDSQKIETALNNLAVTCAETRSTMVKGKRDGSKIQG